ncbi:MAG: general secretion pathway protein GspK [Hyphomicrobiales bacterium]|nr:general secretion pathway protein GspK [Hyphomicrobiales bacterium]MBV8825760.1 general secretion pathway protein GspK [Hyphomicrobiales bacterium]
MPLLSVLWGLALLAAIATSFISAGGTSYRLARNAVDAIEVDVAAEAAVNRVVLGLLDLNAQTQWRTDGVPRLFDFEGTRMQVRVQDELGRIDLNNADGTLLIGLFQSVGLDPQAASALTDKILDWRDSSTLKRLNGAKDPEYRDAGLPYRPRNGPFQSVDELKLVMGMTPELFRRVEPALTVYSGRPSFDPQLAPPEALRALPNMNAQNVAALVASRNAQPAVAALPPIGRAFAIRIDIERPTGVQHRDAVVRVTDHPQQIFWLLSWKDR